jgi:hypothetical protein
MLPTPEHFLEGLAFFARRHAPRAANADGAVIAAAVVEAEQLAGGDEANEPAALFYACARRSRAFGSLARDFIPFAARRQAHAIGCELDALDVELDILRLRVLLGAITFDELRAEFAARRKPRAAG